MHPADSANNGLGIPYSMIKFKGVAKQNGCGCKLLPPPPPPHAVDQLKPLNI
jgi:hypothetical protein